MPEKIDVQPTGMITEEFPIPKEMLAEIEAAGGADKYVEHDQLTFLRNERNKRIAETDWMANSDINMSDEWKEYRQALRDITETYKHVGEVVWPDKPE